MSIFARPFPAIMIANFNWVLLDGKFIEKRISFSLYFNNGLSIISMSYYA